MTGRARVRIDGQAQGAERALASSRKGLQRLGQQGKQTGKDLAQASQQATREEKEFEQAVQHSIRRMQKKSQSAKAQREAMRRLGMEQNRGGGGGRGRGRMPASPAGNRRQLFQGLFEAAGQTGGTVGGGLGQVASSLGQASPAIIGLGIAATGVGLSLAHLAETSRQAAEAAAEVTRAEQERADAIKQAREQLGRNALQAAEAGGPGLRRAVGMGGETLGSIQSLADRLNIDPQQATELSRILRGTSGQDREDILSGVAASQRAGGDPLATAREMRSSAGRGPGVGDSGSGVFGGPLRADILAQRRGEAARERDAIRAGLGDEAANYSEFDLERARRNREVSALDTLRGYGTREGRAAFSTLGDPQALRAADDVTARGAAAARDPAQAALDEINRGIQKQIEVLERMEEAQGRVGRLMDRAQELFGSQDTYQARANRQRGMLSR